MDTFIILKKLFLNCIVSQENGYGSCYKFIYLYCWTISHSLMTLPSINQFELMTYIIIDTEKSKFQTINDTNNQFPERMCCAAMEYILISIADIIYTIGSTYTLIEHLYNEERSSIHHFNANIIVLNRYSIVMYYRLNKYECNDPDETIRDECTNLLVDWMYFYIIHCIIFFMIVSDVWGLISVYQLDLVSFMRILYFFLSFDTIYIHFQSIITSIITILILLLIIFLNCIVIMVAFNDDDCKSYSRFYHCYCLLFIDSITIRSSITSSESIIYELIQWIGQHFNNFNHKFDGNEFKNEKKYQSHGYIRCATIDCT